MNTNTTNSPSPPPHWLSNETPSPSSNHQPLPKSNSLGNLLYQVIDYWFVKYNPLYFFSAFCVLLGIYLVSADLELNDWVGHITLAVVILIYETLLIASAALLFRKAEQYRPAVFLGILEFVFLFDPTFRIETLSGLDYIGIAFNLFWALLVPLKILAILWSFRARAPALTTVVPTLTAIVMVILPLLIKSPDTQTIVHLLANWWGALFIIVAVFWHRQIACELPSQLEELAKLRRIIVGAWSLLIGFYFYHLWNSILWIEQPTLQQMLPQFIPFGIGIAIILRHQAAMWILASLYALWLLNLPYPPVITINSCFFGIILVWHAWRTKQQQLYVLALAAFYLCIWTIGWENTNSFPPRLAWEWQLAAGAVLAWLAFGLRIRLALVIALVGISMGAIYLVWHLRAGIISFFSAIWPVIANFLASLWGGIVSIGLAIWQGLEYLFSGIISLLSSVWQLITTLLTYLWKGIVSIGLAMWQGLEYLFSGIVYLFSSLWSVITNFLAALWGGIVSIGFATWQGLKYLFYLMQLLIPTTSLGWGILLLITGFAALLGGVTLSWKKRT